MNEKIRILIVNGKMICGGIEAFVMNIYRHIDRTKIQFDFLVHYKEEYFYDKEIEELGGRIYRLSFRNDNNIFKYKRDLNNFFTNNHYDIVWGHMEALGGFYFKYAKKNKVKVTIAHSHITNAEKGLKGLVKKYLKNKTKKYTDYNLACSTEAGKYLYKNKFFYLCPNAIDVRKFQYNQKVRNEYRNKYNINEELIVGCVGRFAPQKNHLFIVEIFNNLLKFDKNAKLILCGSGELEDKIKKYIDLNHLNNNVIFMGNVSNMHEYYQMFDCLLMPSLYEGLPVSGIEAQTSGLCCFFADTITREVAIVKENCEFYSLDVSPEIWAQNILKKMQNFQRKDCLQAVKENGYDIQSLADSLKNWFIELSK